MGILASQTGVFHPIAWPIFLWVGERKTRSKAQLDLLYKVVSPASPAASAESERDKESGKQGCKVAMCLGLFHVKSCHSYCFFLELERKELKSQLSRAEAQLRRLSPHAVLAPQPLQGCIFGTTAKGFSFALIWRSTFASQAWRLADSLLPAYKCMTCLYARPCFAGAGRLPTVSPLDFTESSIAHLNKQHAGIHCATDPMPLCSLQNGGWDSWQFSTTRHCSLKRVAHVVCVPLIFKAHTHACAHNKYYMNYDATHRSAEIPQC